jgi:F0F1-type ATP synthase assembly protein I
MENQQPLRDPNLKNKGTSGLKNFARYSSIAFQMIAIILATTWGGMKLDTMTGFKTPVFTIVLSLLGVFAAIYVVIKDLIKFK